MGLRKQDREDAAVKEKPEVLSCSNPTPQVALPLAQLEEHLLSLIQNWDPPSMLILCS